MLSHTVQSQFAPFCFCAQTQPQPAIFVGVTVPTKFAERSSKVEVFVEPATTISLEFALDKPLTN